MRKRRKVWRDVEKFEARQFREAGMSLVGLLREMTLDHSLPSYEVYQVTHGAVADARKALAGHNPQHSTVSA